MEKFQVSTMNIEPVSGIWARGRFEPVAGIWSSSVVSAAHQLSNINKVSSCCLRAFEVFLKVPVIIVIFGENNVFGPLYIEKYQFRGGGGGNWFTFHFSLTIYKNGNNTGSWHILKLNSTSFWSIDFFPYGK